eukprot:gene11321-306_t
MDGFSMDPGLVALGCVLDTGKPTPKKSTLGKGKGKGKAPEVVAEEPLTQLILAAIEAAATPSEDPLNQLVLAMHVVGVEADEGTGELGV